MCWLGQYRAETHALNRPPSVDVFKCFSNRRLSGVRTDLPYAEMQWCRWLMSRVAYGE